MQSVNQDSKPVLSKKLINGRYEIVRMLGTLDPLMRRYTCLAKDTSTLELCVVKLFFPSYSDQEMRAF